MKHNLEQDLQISEFIKDPASLKLLILAGTKIRPNEISTVNKCTSLIKLDLSSNQLFDLPLKFSNFPLMRILYLHDNQLTECSIAKTNLEYISMFDNPIDNYRANLIQNNSKLVAIDCNIITPEEKITLKQPKPHTQLKWPIVQISQDLEHEEDYLNLLKAELFVVTQVYKKATFTDKINQYFKTIKQEVIFRKLKHTYTNQVFFRVDSVKKAAKNWLDYTEKRKKLKRILEGTKVEVYTKNKIERIKATRSKGVGQVVTRFVQSIRERMKARKILEKGFRNYRLQIPVFHILEQKFSQDMVLYFKDSQFYLLDKIFLYAKKLFFGHKQYDLCDNFDKLVQRGKKSYYIFKSRQGYGETLLHQMLKMSMGLVISQKGLDRKNILYNRKGHKSIQIKRVRKLKIKFDREKMLRTDGKIERLYSQYDTLVPVQFKNRRIFSTILHILRYFNSGNADKIQHNRAAYFQTEVVFDDPQISKQKTIITYSCHGLIQRTISANLIQRSWRRYRAVKNLKRNVLKEIKEDRSKKLISRWLRDLKFRHRMKLSKAHSFFKAITKEHQLYLHMDIYMNMPKQTNILNYPLEKFNINKKDDLFKVIHLKSQIQIAEMAGRNWIKIRFLNSQDAIAARKKLSVLTYKYFFNGTFIKLFTLGETHKTTQLEQYEKSIRKLFTINIKELPQKNHDKIKKVQIDNSCAFFIWPYVEDGFATMFKQEQIQSLPISVFIYNKNRRPLKVNCDLLWVLSPSLYHYRTRPRSQIRITVAKKQPQKIDQTMDLYMMPHIRHKLNRERQYSMKQHKSLLQANRQRGHSQMVQLSLLSETLNIKRQ